MKKRGYVYKNTQGSHHHFEGYSAYCPEMPVYAKGKTATTARRRLERGMVAHIKWLRASGDSVPPPPQKS